jgi:hypothetical protein
MPPNRRRAIAAPLADAIRTRDFGKIRTRKLWAGCYLALESRDRAAAQPAILPQRPLIRCKAGLKSEEATWRKRKPVVELQMPRD